MLWMLSVAAAELWFAQQANRAVALGCRARPSAVAARRSPAREKKQGLCRVFVCEVRGEHCVT